MKNSREEQLFRDIKKTEYAIVKYRAKMLYIYNKGYFNLCGVLFQRIVQLRHELIYSRKEHSMYVFNLEHI